MRDQLTTNHVNNIQVANPSIDLPPRPIQVRRACYLVLASLFLGLLTLLPAIHGDRPGEPSIPLFFMLSMVILLGGLIFWLVRKIYQGKSWARWGMLAYLLLGWGLAGSALAEDFLYAPLAGVINIACVAMEGAAAWFLFFGKGAKWYVKIMENHRAQNDKR